MTGFDINAIRSQFPALKQIVDGYEPVFFDGPGGAQVPQGVVDAVADYLGHYCSNVMPSTFFAAKKTVDTVLQAREKAAAFVNARQAEEIFFGPNMTTQTFHLSRALSRNWRAGDEIIVTAMEHFANVSPWITAAQDKGVTVHMARMNPDDCTLDYEHLESLVSPRTKFVAVTYASNVTGSLVDVKRVIQAAHAVGALTFIDAVHYIPHRRVDVQDLDCDFLATSAYKYFGPHIAFIYGKAEHLNSFKPYKVKPSYDEIPWRWETGSLNFEAVHGFNACMDYILSLGQDLSDAYQNIVAYEQEISRYFLKEAAAFPGMKVYGITAPDRLDERTPTFAVTIEGHAPKDVSDHLARHNIAAWHGHFNGTEVIETLSLTDKGGVLRIGCMHYNTVDEIDRLFEMLSML